MHCFLQLHQSSTTTHFSASIHSSLPRLNENTFTPILKRIPIVTMFRARKPSVKRVEVGKHAPKQLPPIKPEPRAVLDAKPEPSIAPSNLTPSAKQDEPQPTNATKGNTMPFRPKLSHMLLPNRTSQPVNRDQPCDSEEESFDTKSDLRYWEKKRHYAPCEGDEDDEEDLTRPVRKDRKVAPESDPLFAQIFAMFPDETAAK